MPSSNKVSPEKTAALILRTASRRPNVALVLGSGFSHVQSALEPVQEIAYEDLPGFPLPQVQGHCGKVLIGQLGTTQVCVLSGRSHFYEGYTLAEITFPIRVMAACGVSTLILTNAAGGINASYRAGDFMCLEDHINLMGDNPLRAWPLTERPTPFVDLSHTYDPSLNRLFRKVARGQRIRLHTGIYAAVPGPSYETPAEVRALRRWGADAVGMNTVPEAIVGKHCGLCVAAVSCITNPAAGLSQRPISHSEVLATGDRVRKQAATLLREFLARVSVSNGQASV